MANTRNWLQDNFRKIGTALDSFIKDITTISNATEIFTVKPTEITFLSLCRIPKQQRDGKLVFYVLSKEYVDDFVEFGEKLRMGAVDREVFGEELCDEIETGTGLLAVINGEKYLVSRSALTTLCQRACISGDTTVNRNNLARDLHLADGLFSRNERINFVYRTAGGLNKIFAAFASDFVLHKQDIITQALQHEDFPFKDFSVRNYSIDNFYTEVELSLPGHAGLIIRNSDVGLSSLVVKVVYRYNDTFIIYSEHALRHDRGMSFEKFLHNTLAEAYDSLSSSKFEEEMDKLSKIPVIDYTDFNEWNPFHKWDNYKGMEESLLNAVYDLLGKQLSKKALRTVTKSLCDSIEPSKPYSYFDVAMMLFEIPNSLTLDAATIANVRKALADFPQTITSLEAIEEHAV